MSDEAVIRDLSKRLAKLEAEVVRYRKGAGGATLLTWRGSRVGGLNGATKVVWGCVDTTGSGSIVNSGSGDWGIYVRHGTGDVTLVWSPSFAATPIAIATSYGGADRVVVANSAGAISTASVRLTRTIGNSGAAADGMIFFMVLGNA